MSWHRLYKVGSNKGGVGWSGTAYTGGTGWGYTQTPARYKVGMGTEGTRRQVKGEGEGGGRAR